MEDLIVGAMFIVSVICYTVYKIDCNHVNKPKNNYPTGGFIDYRSLEKPKIPKGERVSPGINEHKVPSSEELKALLKQKAESGRCSRKPEKAPIPPGSPSEETMESLFGKDYKEEK